MHADSVDTLLKRVTVLRVRGEEAGRHYAGHVLRPLCIGRELVVRTDDGRKLSTTPICRLLVDDPDGRSLYVETRNSAYRIRFEEAVDSPTLRIRLGDNGVEVTSVVGDADVRESKQAASR